MKKKSQPWITRKWPSLSGASKTTIFIWQIFIFEKVMLPKFFIYSAKRAFVWWIFPQTSIGHDSAHIIKISIKIYFCRPLKFCIVRPRSHNFIWMKQILPIDPFKGANVGSELRRWSHLWEIARSCGEIATRGFLFSRSTYCFLTVKKSRLDYFFFLPWSTARPVSMAVCLQLKL